MSKQKVVIEISNISDSKRRSKALQTAVGLFGVTSAAVEGDKLVVVGEGVDSIRMAVLLRKSLGCANIVSVGPAEEKKPAAPAPAPAKAPEPCAVHPPCWTAPCYSQPVYYVSDSWW